MQTITTFIKQYLQRLPKTAVSVSDKSRRCSVDTAFSILDALCKAAAKGVFSLMNVCLSVRIKLCGSLPSSDEFS